MSTCGESNNNASMQPMQVPHYLLVTYTLQPILACALGERLYMLTTCCGALAGLACIQRTSSRQSPRWHYTSVRSLHMLIRFVKAPQKTVTELPDTRSGTATAVVVPEMHIGPSWLSVELQSITWTI
jgi:hypothetical protein